MNTAREGLESVGKWDWFLNHLTYGWDDEGGEVENGEDRGGDMFPTNAREDDTLVGLGRCDGGRAQAGGVDHADWEWEKKERERQGKPDSSSPETSAHR